MKFAIFTITFIFEKRLEFRSTFCRTWRANVSKKHKMNPGNDISLPQYILILHNRYEIQTQTRTENVINATNSDGNKLFEATEKKKKKKKAREQKSETERNSQMHPIPKTCTVLNSYVSFKSHFSMFMQCNPYRKFKIMNIAQQNRKNKPSPWKLWKMKESAYTQNESEKIGTATRKNQTANVEWDPATAH